MTESLFNENMSSSEARIVFLSSVDGKTKEEITKLQEDYMAVLPAIDKRESELVKQGWIID